MKTRLLLLLLAVGPWTGRAGEVAPATTTPAFVWVDPADPAALAFRQAGEQAISRIGNLLIFEVEHSIAENGLVKTLEVAHLKDLVLPKPVRSQPVVTAVKRTSLQLRNPANRPDDADRAALERFNNAIQDGEVVPALLIQRLEPAGAPAEWRVYRPISTMPVCLKCHGAPETLLPEVRAFLRKNYPEDRAAGYAVYQWRGVIRVSLAAAETK